MIDQIQQVVEKSQEPITNTVRNIELFSKALGDNADKVGSVLANSGELASKLSVLATNLDSLVTAVEPQRVDKIVGNIERFSTAMGDSSNDIEVTIANAADISKKQMPPPTTLPAY